MDVSLDYQLKSIESGSNTFPPPKEKPKEDNKVDGRTASSEEERFPCEEFYIGEDEVLAARGELLPEELKYVRKIKEKYGLLEEPPRIEAYTGLQHACSDPRAYRSSKESRARFCYSQPRPPLAHRGKYFKEPRLAKLYSSSTNNSKQSDLADIPEEGDHYYEDSSMSASRVRHKEVLLPISASSHDNATTETNGSDYHSCRGILMLIENGLLGHATSNNCFIFACNHLVET